MNKLLLEIINSYFPIKPWRLSRVRGSILIIDCGNKVFNYERKGEKFFKGEIGFTVYLSKWSFSQKNKIFLTSESLNYKKYDHVFDFIKHYNIISIEETINRRKLKIIFENEYILTLQENIAYYGYQKDMLMGYIDDTWWSYSPHKRFHWEYPEKGMLLENKYELEANKSN